MTPGERKVTRTRGAKPRIMTTSGTPHHSPAARRRQAVLPVLVSLAINAAVPVLAYLLLRPYVHSDISALVIAAAVPTCYTAGVFWWRRRLDPVGAIAIAGFAFGLLLLVATGGNELAFKLREDIWTGPLGLVCLISAALRRPLFFLALRLAARRNAQVAERIGDPGAHRIATVTTVIIGVVLLIHALIMVVLAFTTSTATFLAVSRPISWVTVGGGLAFLVWWIRRQRPGRPNPPAQREPPAAAAPGRGRQSRPSAEERERTADHG
jgi:hypothetical protein